jgi:hypothetical protein
VSTNAFSCAGVAAPAAKATPAKASATQRRMALFYALTSEAGMKARLACAIVVAAVVGPAITQGNAAFDPLQDGGAMCGPPSGGQPAVLRALILAKTETEPFRPVPPNPAMSEAPRLYPNLGTLRFKAGTQSGRAQQWFDQGIRLSFAFNHAEAQRAFREAQKIDPACALCFWGEALVLGPNINVPMMPRRTSPRSPRSPRRWRSRSPRRRATAP